jgi:hypothetical protein
MPQLAQDFCNHALMWHRAQDVPLLETPNQRHTLNPSHH